MDINRGQTKLHGHSYRFTIQHVETQFLLSHSRYVLLKFGGCRLNGLVTTHPTYKQTNIPHNIREPTNFFRRSRLFLFCIGFERLFEKLMVNISEISDNNISFIV